MEQSTGQYDNPYKFNGKELDEESGLYYYGARYYNPRLSIWYGVDPLAEQLPSFSPYAFVRDNPINRIDPDGRFDTKIGAWWHRMWNGGRSKIFRDKSNNQYYYNRNNGISVDENGGLVMHMRREYGYNKGSFSNLIETTNTLSNQIDILPEYSLAKLTTAASTTQGNARILNIDKKVTNNLSTLKNGQGAIDYQFNLGLFNFNSEISSSSVSLGGKISALGRLSVGHSITLSKDILNSDIAINGEENINGDSTTNSVSVGIKPIGIIVAGATIMLERIAPPVLIQQQLNTLIILPTQ